MRKISTLYLVILILSVKINTVNAQPDCGQVLGILHQTFEAKTDKELVENLYSMMQSNKEGKKLTSSSGSGSISVAGYGSLGYGQSKGKISTIIENHSKEENYSLTTGEISDIKSTFYADGDLKTVTDAWLQCIGAGNAFLSLDHNVGNEVIVSLNMPLTEQNRYLRVNVEGIVHSSNLELNLDKSSLEKGDTLQFGLSRSMLFKRLDKDEGTVSIQLNSVTVKTLHIPVIKQPKYEIDTLLKEMELTVNGDLTNGMFRINHPANPDYWQECNVTSRRIPGTSKDEYTANCGNIRTYLPVREGNMVTKSMFTDSRTVAAGKEANYSHLGTGVNPSEGTYTFHGRFTPQSIDVIKGKLTVFYKVTEKRCVSNCP
ncbi:hypothetical protein IQ277_32720 [Nostocales cyanobacterium LEGE 12452]|nr:hypothetical protein [Nostocales cyanobacterium LEGE 12452]